MIIKTSFLAALTMVLLSCKAQNTDEKTSQKKTTETTAMENAGKIQYFTLGEPKFIKGLEANITYKTLVEDSRCPEGTQCVWAGVAKIQLELMGTYTRPSIIELANSNNPTNTPTYVDFNGYRITVKEVYPYPKFTPKNVAKNTTEPVKKVGLEIVKL